MMPDVHWTFATKYHLLHSFSSCQQMSFLVFDQNPEFFVLIFNTRNVGPHSEETFTSRYIYSYLPPYSLVNPFSNSCLRLRKNILNVVLVDWERVSICYVYICTIKFCIYSLSHKSIRFIMIKLRSCLASVDFSHLIGFQLLKYNNY